MPQQIRVFRANTGSCGGCDAELVLALHKERDMTVANALIDADVWLITGIMAPYARSVLSQTYSSMTTPPIIIAVGQCAISGAPYGRAGVGTAPELPISYTVDGCPVSQAVIISAIRSSLTNRDRKRRERA
jgi:energy-converting hydrogenase A subunit N